MIFLADSPSYPDSEDNVGTPRWVKVFGIIAVVLILLFVILHLGGRGLGNHGPFEANTSSSIILMNGEVSA